MELQHGGVIQIMESLQKRRVSNNGNNIPTQPILTQHSFVIMTKLHFGYYWAVCVDVSKCVRVFDCHHFNF